MICAATSSSQWGNQDLEKKTGGAWGLGNGGNGKPERRLIQWSKQELIRFELGLVTGWLWERRILTEESKTQMTDWVWLVRDRVGRLQWHWLSSRSSEACFPTWPVLTPDPQIQVLCVCSFIHSSNIYRDIQNARSCVGHWRLRWFLNEAHMQSVTKQAPTCPSKLVTHLLNPFSALANSHCT